MKRMKKVLSCLTSAMMILTLSTPVFAAETGVATGTQKAYIVGDDWGCGVSKTIMTLDKTIDADSVAATDFSVEEVVNETQSSQRTILDAYTSDENGNKISENSNVVTIEMEISPSEGNPISWSMATWRNSWASPYELKVSIVEGEDITSGVETINELNVESEIDVAGNGKICPQLDGFSFAENYKSLEFTDEYGTISYSLYTPAKDSHKNALVIWNHGIGETGEDVQIDLLGNEVTALGSDEFQNVMDGAYILVPQRRSGTNVETVYNLAKKIIAENDDIDADRVIVGGCSAGGGATLQMIYAHPEFYAAAYPICPAGAGSSTYVDNVEIIKNLPIWFIHAKNDDTVNISGTEALVKALEEIGGDVHTSYFEDVHDTTGRFTNEDGTPYQYSGHWSWTYFDNNECYDENGVNLWEWMSVQTKAESVVATGTQKAYVIGDDWGPAVNKTVIKLDKVVDADSVVAENFKVIEEKNLTNWGENPDVPFGSEYVGQNNRTVIDAYVSNANGDKVNDSSRYVTIEMHVSPSEGSPFIYSLATGFNSWCNTYKLHVSLAKGATLTAGDQTITGLNVTADIDVAGDGKICPQLDQFNIYEKAYTASDGTVYSYADYAPAKDDKKNALVIWLHGAGEGKYDPSIDILGNEVTAFVSEEFQEALNDAYVLVPQCPTMWMDDGTGTYQNGDKGSCYKNSLMELIKDYVSANDDIDPNKIIIGGCSNGGYMTMEMILANPDYFAAAFPICEAFYDEYITDKQIESIKDMGIWFTYAKNDDTVDPTKCSEPTIQRLLAAGAKNVHVSVFDDVHDTTGRFVDADGNPYQYSGHWSWTYFDNNECYDENGVNAWQWLGQQVKTNSLVTKPEASNPNKGTGSSVKTGDDSAIAGYAILFMAAAAGYTVLKRKEN